MTCEELVHYLSAYIDHELDAELSRDAQEHLATCQRCQVVLNTTQRLILLGHDQRRYVVSGALRENLYRRIEQSLYHKPAGQG
ncbi:MAG TPA: zf-HC2 domain-containing protein [Ktedonobacterales bacterium]|nr:zf-HC2 domain-containing protein [Ktedonobacterales bacterium]